MMRAGRSWSGRERNGCYLNLGGGRFANASFTSGLDFDDDGRAVAVTDWDGDGDLDLWLKNRTGPQLRFMLNRSSAGPGWLALELQGAGANRDAIGARVVVHTGERALQQYVSAGDGYLSQSSKRLHFGLATAATIERVEVHWPGAPSETIDGVEPGQRYRILQGSGVATPTPRRSVDLQPSVPASAAAPSPWRILLKVPLPLPPGWIQAKGGLQDFTLINLWAQWCAPCIDELERFARSCESLANDGIRIQALGTDAPEDLDRARESFEIRVASAMTGPGFEQRPAGAPFMKTLEVLLAHVRGRDEELKLPTSLLVDGRGRLQMIYVGAVSPEMLREDAARLRDPDFGASRRALYPGRWYFQTPRDLAGLARELRRRGADSDAAFYGALHHVGQRGAADRD